ncbi:hypothetical protein H257_04777 [Aphanomyces astaci]|uniref:Endonuclease/exonuclease/phosphatase domain-containing protein n=1 Tax=Aphanomyces astaci TaxID=112090 RepID=W4GVH9_APHAT|nr:hypothetical protein H257_04777 [Aphanomyces astaci]ETV83034.1 hypothetical protein H257_04777 [Aphanomyces astaci]|eukprot:XP_009827705.1 hypothetical protein H257_04777 [Aphanomyces astaci]
MRMTAVLDESKLTILFIIKGAIGGRIEASEFPIFPGGHSYVVQEKAWMGDRVRKSYLRTVLHDDIEEASVILVAHLYDIHESGFVSLSHIGITRWDQELGRFVVPTDEVDDTATPVDDSTMTQVVNLARRLKQPPTCVVFQETMNRNAQQLDTFQHHLNNEVGAGNYVLFTNDPRATSADPVHRRHCGVASFFHKSMPGFASLVHLVNHDIPGRYLVVRTEWSGLPVYIHNIYAPVEPHLRGAFFAALPRDFEHDSLHLVGGDFNRSF